MWPKTWRNDNDVATDDDDDDDDDDDGDDDDNDDGHKNYALCHSGILLFDFCFGYCII